MAPGAARAMESWWKVATSWPSLVNTRAMSHSGNCALEFHSHFKTLVILDDSTE